MTGFEMHDTGSRSARIAALAAVLLIAGCVSTVFESTGTVMHPQLKSTGWQYVRVSPGSDGATAETMRTHLTGKGYVILADGAAPQSVPRATVVVFDCRSAGTTGRPNGWSQKVQCTATEQGSGKMVYLGRGDYMGSTPSDDFRGATEAALASVPRARMARR